MALTRIEVQPSHDDDTSGGPTSTLKWDTLRAVHGGISVDQSPVPRCGRSGERDTDSDYADDELNDLGLPSAQRSSPYRESDAKNPAASAFRGAVSLHHPDHDHFAVLPVTPQKTRRVYDSDTSTSPSVGSTETLSLSPSFDSPGSTPSLADAQLSCSPYPENERDIEMTPGDLCSIRTPDLHRVAPTMARDRVQLNLNQAAHLPAYLLGVGVGRVSSPAAKYDGLQSSPAKFEVVEEDEEDVDTD